MVDFALLVFQVDSLEVVFFCNACGKNEQRKDLWGELTVQQERTKEKNLWGN